MSSRRDFLKVMGVAGGGLIAGLPLSACAGNAEKPGLPFNANPLLQVRPDNSVHFYLPRSEMGQGTWTGLTTIVAEELDVSPEAIVVHHAPAGDAFVNPQYGMQITGGSNSIAAHYRPLRQLAADMREALRQSAARRFGVDVAALETKAGTIVYKGEAYPYGRFAEAAAAQAMPVNTPLKPAEQFRSIGRDSPRLDGLAKSTGTAEFGIDIDFEGLHRAVMLRSPVRGGRLKTADTRAAKASPGVVQVLEFPEGVAIVAKNYWQARKAAELVSCEWTSPALAKFGTDSLREDLGVALDRKRGLKSLLEGEGAGALDDADAVLEAEYFAPYLAHACMEPLNCTVRINADKTVDVWVGSQGPEVARGAAAMFCGVSKDQVTLHSTFLGGGFGRRSYPDNVAEAAMIAKKSGLPIQLMWSREDDTQFDYYRPASLVRYRAALNKDGSIKALEARRSGADVTAYVADSTADALAPGFLPDRLVDWVSKAGYPLFAHVFTDPSSVEGLVDDYDIPHREVRHVTADPGLPVGYWRSVGHSFSGFFIESFMDELALAAGSDPLSFRRRHLQGNPRLAGVLDAVAEAANFGTVATGQGQGIAAHYSFGSYVAQVAEVSVEAGKIRVHRVVCAVDCGLVINPDMVVAQIESGIIFALTAALYGDIKVDKGVVSNANFHDTPLLRMNESPEIVVKLVSSDAEPSGVGEPGVPPLAAAVSNAIFALTGERLRSLPLRL